MMCFRQYIEKTLEDLDTIGQMPFLNFYDVCWGGVAFACEQEIQLGIIIKAAIT